MRGFLQLINLLVSLTGFILVCGTLIARGESLLTSVLRAVLVFAVLWVVQGLLSSVLGIAVYSDSSDRESEEQR